MIPRDAYFPQVDQQLAGLLREQSLELLGVSSVWPVSAGEAADYREWIEGGYHGSMAYLESHEPMKYNAGAVLPGCRSVIMVGLNYYQEADGSRHPGNGRKPESGRIARYAWGRDYHNALGTRLRRVAKRLTAIHPGERFRALVDASPLSERFFAANAGVGFTARNTLTISSAYGSWFFLGEILSTVEYPDTATSEGTHGACPRGCFRCGAVCPTDALFGPYRIDARRCISYLTIEHRGRIDPQLRPLMGDWVFGCDLCQEVCPLNLHARPTQLEDFTAHRAGRDLDLRQVLTIRSDAGYRRLFAGTPLLRPGRASMIRNASIAAANTGSVTLLPVLRGLSRDENRIVSEHAAWAVHQLEKE